MRYVLSIIALAVLASVAVAAVPSAGEKTPLEAYLESLPPMDPGVRAAFDKAARSMYHAECECLRFWIDGDVHTAKLPLNDADRRLIIEGLQRGLFHPLASNGRDS